MLRAFVSCAMAIVFVKPGTVLHWTGHDLSAQCGIEDCT